MPQSSLKIIISIPFFLALIFITACANAANLTPITPSLKIDQIKSNHDQDQDGLEDYQDILSAARSQIGIVTKYDTSYYAGAFPPADKGACADVIWRALQVAGFDFKKNLDQDMQKHPQDYPSNPKPDKNINFRRVQNIRIYLNKYAQKLITEVIPNDQNNLKQWQGGDIVTYAQIPGGLWHIAIVSSNRRSDGVPLLIHNYGRGVREDDYLLKWPTKITGHFRFNLF